MSTAKPRLALQLLDAELARFVSLLSHEAAGIALRILDIQHRTGAGLPDGKTTHLQLGLQKRRWVLLREELLRVFSAEDGALVFKPTLERQAEQTKRATRASAAARSARTKAKQEGASSTDTPTERPVATVQKVGAPKSKARDGAAAAGADDQSRPLSPLAVLDEANASLAQSTNVVKLPDASRGRKPAQTILPGFAANPAAAAGQPDDIPNAKKLCFDIGIKLLTRYNGMSETAARHRIGKLLTEWEAHFVYAAIMDAARHRNTIVNPIGWIGNKLKEFPDKAASRAARVAKSKGQAPAAPRKQSPKATAKFMGLSEQRAARLAEKSRQIESGGSTPPAARPGKPSDKAPAKTAGADATARKKTDDQIFHALAF